ncbi:MAG: DNA starvation/stationary phase protection protein [Fimbriimonadaceae bacterium]|nr:DNA starvation/stationary phase protection protein [Fimbriimonadaceae bacterium]
MAKNVADALNRLLADSYVLQLKTQNYHWNVTGPEFYQLHLLFEAQYNELFAGIDVIAEHIRTLGNGSPGTMKEFLALTSISEGTAKTASDMVADLAGSHAALAKTCQALIDAADDADDDASEDLAIQRQRVHKSAAWMLKATVSTSVTLPKAAPAPAKAKPTPKTAPKVAAAKAAPAKAESAPAPKKAAPKRKPASKPKAATKPAPKPAAEPAANTQNPRRRASG